MQHTTNCVRKRSKSNDDDELLFILERSRNDQESDGGSDRECLDFYVDDREGDDDDDDKSSSDSLQITVVSSVSDAHKSLARASFTYKDEAMRFSQVLRFFMCVDLDEALFCEIWPQFALRLPHHLWMVYSQRLHFNTLDFLCYLDTENVAALLDYIQRRNCQPQAVGV